ncbi:MAG: hypothetical protein JWO36_797, partial [Myxococcales bacterium]|nr:hypothetical protein [Myxococcales bacterium]
METADLAARSIRRMVGVSIKVASCFQFVTTVTAPHEDLAGVRLWHRPTGFVFDDPTGRGHIKLRWPDRPYSG